RIQNIEINMHVHFSKVASGIREMLPQLLGGIDLVHAGIFKQGTFGGLKGASAEEHNAVTRNWRKSGNGFCECMPGAAQQHTDRHAIEKAGYGRVWRCRFAVGVEPDDAGLTCAAAAYCA